MDLIEQIAPVAGGIALIGLGVLAFLLFQQGREIRRLREWAGRAPERAIDAAVASLAAAEARSRHPEVAAELPEGEEGTGEYAEELAEAERTYYRRPRLWPKLVAGLLALVLIGGVVMLTDGFGLLGEDETPVAEEQDGGEEKPPLPEPESVTVAVLNATQGATGAVPGLAGTISETVVQPLSYDVVIEADATSSSPSTAVMYTGDNRRLANRFARQVRNQLGEINVTRMNSQIESDADGADLALVIGLDRSTFGQ